MGHWEISALGSVSEFKQKYYLLHKINFVWLRGCIYFCWMFFQQFPTYRLEACNFVSEKMVIIACTKFAELILEDLWGGFLFFKIKTWNYAEKKLPRSRFSCKSIRVFSASWEKCSLDNLIKNTVHLRNFLKIANFGNIFRKESMINYVYSSLCILYSESL